MKQTKDKIVVADLAERKGISGLKAFDGEDLSKYLDYNNSSIRGKDESTKDPTKRLD